MRYWEIIEGSVGSGTGEAKEVWNQSRRTADALRALRAKQAQAAADRIAAQGMPAGKVRSDRLRAADRREADARRVYDNARNKANDATSRALARAYSKH